MIPTFVNRIRIFINNLSSQRFYQGIGIASGILLLLIGLFIWLYFSSINSLQEQLEHLNEQREVVKKILDKEQRVSSQRKEIDELLAKDKDFKIKIYFEDLLDNKLQLKNKISGAIKADSYPTEDGYSSDVLQAHLEGLSMKELVTLLQALESNQRLYFKDLDIIKSKKPVNTLDVTITIATLQPAVKQFEVGATS
jgi:type II secretory pathway component PulM